MPPPSVSRSRAGLSLSFVFGFGSALLLVYVLTYFHIFNSGTTLPSSLSSLDVRGSDVRERQAEELLSLVKQVDQLLASGESNLRTRSETKSSEMTTPTTKLRQIHKSLHAIASNASQIKSSAAALDIEMSGVDVSVIRQIPTSRLGNVILALAANIDPKFFAIFCRSLRLAGSQAATAIVFVNAPISDDVLRIAKENDVVLVPYKVAELQPAFLRKYHPSSLRWILYHRLLQLPLNVDGKLRQLFELVSKVVVLDARDTAFQRDPFSLFAAAHEGGERLLAFGEVRGARIDQCGWNSGWVKDCFGEIVLRKVGSQHILCSGVSMGTVGAMQKYLEAMSTILLGQSAGTYFNHQLPRSERNGVDQGIHNVLIHLHFKHSHDMRTDVLYPDNFAVVNMQSAKDVAVNNNYKLQLEGQKASPLAVYMNNAYGQQDKLFAIVHQYDRVERLQRSLAESYISWIDWSDPESEWKQTEACSAFGYVRDVELFRGMCDLGHVRTLSAASCCEACNRKSREIHEQDPKDGRQCRGFSYTGGVCYLKSCDEQSTKRQLQRHQQRSGAGGVGSLPGGICAYMKA